MELDDHQAKILGAIMGKQGASPVMASLADAGRTSVSDAGRALLEKARNPDTPREEVLRLGSSENAVVRATVAARSDCPLGLLIALVDDRSLDVRVALAGNPQAGSVLGRLAEDKHAEVVQEVVANPSTPTEVLVALAGHRNKEIRTTAGNRLVALNAHPAARSAPELRDRPFDRTAGEPPSAWPSR